MDAKQHVETADAPGEGAAGRSAEAYSNKVPAVDQAVRLLFALAGAERGEASLDELAGRGGTDRNHTLAILDTLRHAGLVAHGRQGTGYALGPNLLPLGQALLNNTDLARAAAPFLDELAATTGCSICLGIVLGPALVVVERRHPPGGGYVPLNIWSRSPLTWGAHGSAYLAALPVDEFEQLFKELFLEGHGEPDADAVDAEMVRRQVEECRRLGYARSVETAGSGQSALSVALKASSPDMSGGPKVVGCIVALGSIEPDRAGEIGRLLVEAASRMSRDLAPWLEVGRPRN